VAKATYAENSDGISSLCTGSLECVEGRDACAEDWRCLRRIQFIGNGNQSSMPDKHHLRIAAVARGTNEMLVLAKLEPAAATMFAVIAVAAKSTDSNPLSQFPDRVNIRTYGSDPAYDLVARNATALKRCFLDIASIGAAYAASLYFDKDLL